MSYAFASSPNSPSAGILFIPWIPLRISSNARSLELVWTCLARAWLSGCTSLRTGRLTQLFTGTSGSCRSATTGSVDQVSDLRRRQCGLRVYIEDAPGLGKSARQARGTIATAACTPGARRVQWANAFDGPTPRARRLTHGRGSVRLILTQARLFWSAALFRRFLCFCEVQPSHQKHDSARRFRRKSGGKAPQSKSSLV